MGKKGIAHRRFSKEEKLKIVKEHLEEHESIKALEKKYSIEHSTISRWVQVYLEDGENALEPHNGNPYAALHTSKHSDVHFFAQYRQKGFAIQSKLRSTHFTQQ